MSASPTTEFARRPDGTRIAFELAGDPGGAPVLVCHGLADSRLCARLLASAAAAQGLRIIAPDRPGTGLTDMRHLDRVGDWVHDAATVLGALRTDRAAVLGISGGGAFATACAAALPDRVHRLVLISPLGLAAWGTGGFAVGERLSLAVATRAPAFGGWFLERLAALARTSPELFLKLATIEMPQVDRVALGSRDQRDTFIEGYLEAFRRGRSGVAQDLRVLRRPWGVELGSISAPTDVYHGEADTTVSPEHARRFAHAIPGARLHIHPGRGHFSLLGDAADQVLGELSP